MPDQTTPVATTCEPKGDARPAAPRFKTRGLDWWTPPPETALNAPIPYVVQLVEDGLSLTEARVYGFITRPDNRLKNDTGARGFICDPGGYGAIAKACGVCRKTAYNAVKSLQVKQALREHELIVRGQQRIRTRYFALHFGDLLPAWRADPKLFKTNAEPARVVVMGRRKTLTTIERAAEYKMNPDRAPLRGCGIGRSEYAQAKRAAKLEATQQPAPPALPTDEEIAAVYARLQLADAKPNLKDAIDLIACARAEALRVDGGEIKAHIIAELTTHIEKDYKRSREHPFPKPGWFLTKMPGYVAEWIRRNRPEPRARTG